jgi:hypothetical protein
LKKNCHKPSETGQTVPITNVQLIFEEECSQRALKMTIFANSKWAIKPVRALFKSAHAGISVTLSAGMQILIDIKSYL